MATGPSLSMRRGRPIKYPRPQDCPHLDRPEHVNGVCYQCSSNINNQRKREKKLEDGGMPEPPKRRRRKDNEYDENDEYSDFLELNVGGKIFATTVATVNREMSLLSVLLFGGQQAMNNYARYDRQGRLFIDRDPTYFRWILNYLRDGYLVTIPSEVHERMQILQEARFYSLNSLSGIISNPHQTQQVHPQILHAQALARAHAQQAHAYQLHLMQAAQYQQMLEEQKKQAAVEKKEHEGAAETPSFLTARPSTRGIFYLSEGKWQTIFPESAWTTVGVRFEDSSDEISFLSLNYTLQNDANGCIPVYQSSIELCRTRLQINETAKTQVDVNNHVNPDQRSPKYVANAEFWWEPSQSQYPQLCARVSRDDIKVSGPMDFIRTEPE